MLEVRGLTAAYGKHAALNGVSLSVKRGEIVVILGANGAGKSTLLKAVSGICEGRVDGSVTLQGAELLGLSPHRIVAAGVALVPEGRGVFGDLTVAENLTLGAYAPRARDEEAGNLDRVLRLFPRLGERRGQIVRTMSGGEQQMVAIGRAMMSNPTLLTLDEPSLGLSPLLCKELFQSLAAIRQSGIGILLVEQNARQSLAIADRGYLLENGEIVHAGRAAELRDDPAVQAAYLGAASGGARVAAPGALRPADRPAPAPAPAGGPATSPAAAAAPRPSGPSPHDIAAAALAALRPAPAPAPAPATAPATAAVPAARAMPAPAAPRTPPPAPPPPVAASGHSAADALLGGLSLSRLVAEAGAASRARYGSAAPAAPPRPARADTSPDMPRPGDLRPGQGEDRLKSVLTEIEDAAARARAWRPENRPKMGERQC